MAYPPEPVSGLPARRTALAMLDGVLRRGDTLELALLQCGRGLAAEDRALAMAIAAETLRWLTDLDTMIDSATQQRLGDDVKVRSVLRLMLAQHLRLDTPPHAILATALPLLSGGPRRLAHGVFSALLRQGRTLPPHPELPPQLAMRWEAAWPGRSEVIARALALAPPLDLTLRDSSETALWAERLEAQVLGPGQLRLARGRAIDSLPGFADGAWWVQDFAAAQPARLLGEGAGRRVLDLCAAPGGKTLQLAAAGWQVTALDISGKRLDRLRQNLARTGLSAEVIVADGRKADLGEASFDAILLDAPCSATGTCRRHPDVLHRLLPLAHTTALQTALLSRAAGWLAPGGKLIYAVCSLEPEEGEGQARAVTALAPDPISAGELPAPLRPTAEGWLRTDPGMLAERGGMDGFFAARFVRQADPSPGRSER